MAHRFERWDHLEDEEEIIIMPVLRRQRVLRDRLHPLDMYDDFDLYSRFRFPRAEIEKITDLLAADLQHDSDRNGALSPSLSVPGITLFRYGLISKLGWGFNSSA